MELTLYEHFLNYIEHLDQETLKGVGYHQKRGNTHFIIVEDADVIVMIYCSLMMDLHKETSLFHQLA